ncbi:hypothetical protein R1sor_010463 [Riccia sorocarpa]|uniref:Reverse transcriptase domain-containing protein n=1 Tax=Riccia sorocarpa TaxID=122646 RepID=A0ABD3I1U1_9MARC
MSHSQGPACTFSEDEVTQELRRLGANKAVDLGGLSAELLRWGGPVLQKELALMLSKASCEGLPAAWTHHKVVPFYKQGPRNDPASYRTIMVASIFAKLYGRILEGHLSRWCEEKGVRAPAQVGFRRDHSTLDHSLTLRVILEEAKRSKKPFYALFVDFSKAFDTVSRKLLGDRLRSLQVPAELLAAITVLYEKVLVKIKADDLGIESTLGVIQGCPLSPTLFGLLIDVLYEYIREHDEGFALGTQSVSVLLFADDVVLIANSESQLHRLVRLLETFCHQSEMSVNLSKTKWLRRGTGLAEPVMFQGQPIAECQKYKYSGLEFTSNLAWPDCVKARTASALRALYAFKSKCYNLGLITWPLKVRLIVTLVQSVILFGCPIWGPTISRSSWSKIEAVHKRFHKRFHTRHSESHMQGGWTADLHRWAAQWEFPEENWRPVEGLRDRLSQAVIRKLWAEPSPRQAYYLRDISRMSSYKEQAYLVADIPRRILPNNPFLGSVAYNTSTSTSTLPCGVRLVNANRLMEEDGPATEIPAEKLFSILHDAKVLKEPVKRIDDYQEETGLTWESNSWGDWRRQRVELVRDETVKDRIKYKTIAIDLTKGTDRPVFEHWLWNGRIAAEHTNFGTLLKGK